jgi:hypothetical protein
MTDAVTRVFSYLVRRKLARGTDYEVIHGFDLGERTEVELLASDLEDLIDEINGHRYNCQCGGE